MSALEVWLSLSRHCRPTPISSLSLSLSLYLSLSIYIYICIYIFQALLSIGALRTLARNEYFHFAKVFERTSTKTVNKRGVAIRKRKKGTRRIEPIQRRKKKTPPNQKNIDIEGHQFRPAFHCARACCRENSSTASPVTIRLAHAGSCSALPSTPKRRVYSPGNKRSVPNTSTDERTFTWRATFKEGHQNIFWG